MINNAQVELSKKLWEQARESASNAHESWRLVILSQKALRDSYLTAGYPFTEATKEFEILMNEHSKIYTSALEYMDNMSAAYGKNLEQFQKTSDSFKED